MKNRVVALSGGVGGAKLALGLHRILDPGQLLIVANTGDDFEHFSLPVCPDLDTLMYTLAGLSNQDAGWGRANETWTFMQAIAAYGGADWFNLGDGDLATHVLRAQRLREGQTLTRVTRDLCARLDIRTQIIPMSDDRVRTMVKTADGELPFQHYFVKLRCRPSVRGFRFAGSTRARPNPLFMAALKDPFLAAVIVCPSNPFISIDPILALPGVRAALRDCSAPVVAVSPIIGGAAVKGPTAKMMRELKMPGDAAAIADYYADFLDGFVLDNEDRALSARLAMPALVTKTLMTTLDEREDLARATLAFAAQLTQPYEK